MTQVPRSEFHVSHAENTRPGVRTQTKKNRAKAADVKKLPGKLSMRTGMCMLHNNTVQTQGVLTHGKWFRISELQRPMQENSKVRKESQ